MKKGLFSLTMLAAAATVLFGCMEQTVDAPVFGVDLNYIAVRQLPNGQYQLGVDYSIYSNQGTTKADVYIDGKVHAVDSIAGGGYSKISDVDGVTWFNIDDPGNTQHTVYVEAHDASGKLATSEKKQFTRNMRMVLVEIITSANCIPCAPANETYKDGTESEIAQLRVATVKYHVWWPRPTDKLYLATKELSKARVAYVAGIPQPPSIPDCWVDSHQIGSTAKDWVLNAKLETATAPEALIDLSKEDIGGNVKLTINVHGLATGKYSDLRLMTVVTESNIEYNDGNAEYTHYDVMRDILPSVDGEDVTIADNADATFTQDITISPDWVKDNLHAVVFLQSAGSKTILQAARISLK